MKKTILYLFVLVLLITSVSALDTRQGEEISIKKEVNENLFLTGGDIVIDAQVNKDLLACGGNVEVNALVQEDTYLCGGTITINSPVNGDLLIAGGNIQVKEDVKGDLRIIGGNIEIEGNIAGDVQVIGGTIKISSENIGGDVSVVGGDFVLESDVAGDVEFKGGTLTIKGVINNSVTVNVDSIKLSEGALIKGNLRYTSASEPELNEEQVEGSILKTGEKKKTQFFKDIPGRIIGALALLLVSILFVLAFPTLSNQLADKIKNKFWQSLLFGFITLVVVPVAAIIIAITLIGIPIALILIFVYIAAIYLSKIFAALWLGKLIVKQKNLMLPVIIGIVIYVIVVNIPYIGGWVRFITILLGMGAMTLMIFGKKKKGKK